MYEFLIEERIKNAMNRVMDQSITHTCLMDITLFWVVDPERLIRTVPIRFLREFAVKCNDIVRQMEGECYNIFASPLAAEKLLPCREEILNGNDILIGMAQPPTPLSLSLSLAKRLDPQPDQRGIPGVDDHRSAYS